MLHLSFNAPPLDARLAEGLALEAEWAEHCQLATLV
jgi:hypothetical protein